MNNPEIRPLLLRETAEIAFTEIKRFVETRLTADFHLRRVSAPLCLPAGSGLGGPAPHITFPAAGSGRTMEIVSGLDLWLRSQLERYDSAPGFGVFTVMNAIRPEVAETAISSPHITSWAWQQVMPEEPITPRKALSEAARHIYALLRDTEKMILEKFPHLSPALPEEFAVIEAAEVAAAEPADDFLRSRYIYLRERPHTAVFIINEESEEETAMPVEAPGSVSGTLAVWNHMVRTTLNLADISIFPAGNHNDTASIGGNIWRDKVALHILHQTEILK